jgi:hypothetical protein
MNINETLEQRGGRYGSIEDEAHISQHIVDFYQSLPGWQNLDATLRHCLIMDAVKTARILNGDPKYPDNWHDKAGYATLAEKHVSKPITNLVEELMHRDEREHRQFERGGAGRV